MQLGIRRERPHVVFGWGDHEHGDVRLVVHGDAAADRHAAAAVERESLVHRERASHGARWTFRPRRVTDASRFLFKNSRHSRNYGYENHVNNKHLYVYHTFWPRRPSLPSPS